jgi:hypothetical protein
MYVVWRLAKQLSLGTCYNQLSLGHLKNWSTGSETGDNTLGLRQFLDALAACLPAPP